ncbi:MAG: hypothetical protein ABGX25_03315, partial [Nautiliaceae bacterium]
KKILTVIAKDWRENSGKIKEIANNFEEYFKASEKRKFEEEISENVLQKIKEKREIPFIDTKKITAWNAMMISALFKAGEFEQKYKEEAINTLEELLKEMY